MPITRRTVKVYNAQDEPVVVEIVRNLTKVDVPSACHKVHEVQRLDTGDRSVLHVWEASLPRLQDDKASYWENERRGEFFSSLDRIKKDMPDVLKLSHPNILPYEAYAIDRSVIDVKVYLLQSFSFFRTMAGHKANGPPREKFLVECAKYCLEGLAYLHREGTYHGDLRETCLLAGSCINEFCVSDFNIDKKITSAFLNYLNRELPSRYRPTGSDDSKRDIYTLALILVQMVRSKPLAMVSFIFIYLFLFLI